MNSIGPRSQLRTGPSSEPITLATAKAHLRLLTDADDALITALITVSRQECERYTGRALISQTWSDWWDSFNWRWLDSETDDQGVVIGMAPVISVDAINLYADDGTFTAYDSDNQWFAEIGTAVPMVHFITWAPTPMRQRQGIEIQYTAGYGAAADVPLALVQGMLAMIASLYENRGDTAIGLSPLVKMLWQPYKRMFL